MLLFSPEKAAQGAGVLELVAALNAEVEFVDGSLISFAKSARSRECAARQRRLDARRRGFDSLECEAQIAAALEQEAASARARPGIKITAA